MIQRFNLKPLVLATEGEWLTTMPAVSRFAATTIAIAIVSYLAASAEGGKSAAVQDAPSELLCQGECTSADRPLPPALLPGPLAPRAFRPLATGQIAPAGWLLDQLLLQANSLSGYMSQSTFPGADHINTSVWVDPNGSEWVTAVWATASVHHAPRTTLHAPSSSLPSLRRVYIAIRRILLTTVPPLSFPIAMLAAVKSRTIQWLPYWTNGNVPLVALIRAAGPEAVAKLDGNLNLGDVVDGYMQVGFWINQTEAVQNCLC